MGQFRYSDAVDTLRVLIDSSSATEDDRVDLAIALLNRRRGDDLSESAELLDSIVEQDPSNLRAKYCRALLLFNEGEMSRAQDLFKQVAESDPQDAYAAYYVGQSYFARGGYKDAAPWFRIARNADPYLRSASYGLFQALRRTGDSAGAKEAFEVFQRLAENPRSRLAELKYTRMGPKAEVRAGESQTFSSPLPSGPLFESAQPLLESKGIDWIPEAEASVTAADLDSDGQAELFLAGALADGKNLVLRQDGGLFAPIDDHPLAMIEGVNTALWGDFDNDGLVDAYLCREGPNMLMRQGPVGEWSDATDSTSAAGSGGDTIDGLCFDLDHDGDLDYLLVNSDSPRELLNNDRDGGFREIANELDIDGAADGSRRVIVADLDGDDDSDLIFLNDDRPHEVLTNDRLWRYSATEGFDEFVDHPITACVAVDTDVNGQAELFTAGPEGVRRWTPNPEGRWVGEVLTNEAAIELGCYDCNGDTRVELLVRETKQWSLIDASDGKTIHQEQLEDAGSGLHLLIGAEGPEVVTTQPGEPPLAWKPGGGRFPFALVRLVGKTDKAAEMRSNASGVGVRGVARVGPRWAPLPEGKLVSSAGHSLQPHAIGSGGAAQVDFLRLLWPDGVSQTELDLSVGASHTIPETQRQAGSCPLVFVWDGEQDRFIADLLGAGGIGFNLGRGEYYPPRPVENLLLPEGCLAPRDGCYTVRLGEPMEEICYFDAVRLVAYDLPAGWRVTLDERFAGLGPAPNGDPVFFRTELLPSRATNDRGQDITTSLQSEDGKPAPLARSDRRFIGLCEPHWVVVEFDQPLDSLNTPTLRFHGWVEYAYSQSAFAAWQAGEEFLEPTIEARGKNGEWVIVAERFGFPAGTPREGSVLLNKSRLPSKTSALRISTNMQVYWDRLTVIDSEPCPNAKRSETKLLSAEVADVGFSQRVMHPHRRSEYDYASRPPFGDTRHPAGFYTAFGDAKALVSTVDDAVAIIGPGEEVCLEFAALQPPGGGRRRRWVLESNGWCKDADLFTKNSGTVGPLPTRSGEDETTPRREKLHADYNTRFRSGY